MSYSQNEIIWYFFFLHWFMQSANITLLFHQFHKVMFENHKSCLTFSSLHTHFNTSKKKSGKTLWKKVKLLKMSNFTFFHNIFYATCILNSLNPFPHNDTFWRLWETSLLKTLWEKEKLLVMSNFSFSHGVFDRFG